MKIARSRARQGKIRRIRKDSPSYNLIRTGLNHLIISKNQVIEVRWMMRSKIHKATVTEADINYVGSVTIDADLLEKSGLMPGEKVLIVDNTNGARLETYTIVGDRGSGCICINGAAAHLIKKGDEVIIIGFELTDIPISQKAVLVDGNNRFIRYLTEKQNHQIRDLT